MDWEPHGDTKGEGVRSGRIRERSGGDGKLCPVDVKLGSFVGLLVVAGLRECFWFGRPWKLEK